MDIKEKLNLLPDDPGIYRFLDREKKIIYIGKAKNLRKRARGYFISSSQNDPRLKPFVSEITDLEWIVTNTEVEALILEDKLIKAHKPRYNIQQRDDNSYLYFRLSVREKYPRLNLTRDVRKDGALYFGPYIGANQARATWRAIKKNFPLRQSKMKLDGDKIYRPCLNYQLKRCLAPCAGLVSPEDYNQMVREVIQLLKGNYKELIRLLKKKMKKKAEELKFEEAAVIRDQIQAARYTLQKQRIVSGRKINQDALALVRSGPRAGAQVLFVRRGILISDDFFFFPKADRYNDQEILRFAISKLYLAPDKVIPDRLLIPFVYEDSQILEDYCRTHKNSELKIICPQRGENKSLVDLAKKNALQNLSVETSKSETNYEIIKETQRRLRLRNAPRRVECFDISNISGSDTAGAMVVWLDNKPLKSDYRKYKVKTVLGANDYAAMDEVLNRRYQRLIDEERTPPDLILIDGGKGQLAAAEKALKNAGVDLDKTDLIGLAKGRSEKRRRAGFEPEISSPKEEEDYEYVVKPGQKNEIRLKKNSAPLYFLQNIRDEAHRFAIEYHRRLRGKRGVSSALENIPGIGPKKRKLLLRSLGGLNNIKKADFERIKSVKGISDKDAANIVRYFEDA